MNVFCLPGLHGGPTVEFGVDGGMEAPKAWRQLRASYDSKTDEWYYNPESGASVWVCPKHTLKGEPECN